MKLGWGMICESSSYVWRYNMTTQKTFTAIVERDPESGWLIGEATELPGCYTQAPDLPSLKINLREAIAVYLQTACKIGKSPEFVGAFRIGIAA